jgi:hypothetical protein
MIYKCFHGMVTQEGGRFKVDMTYWNIIGKAKTLRLTEKSYCGTTERRFRTFKEASEELWKCLGKWIWEIN